MRNRRDVTFKLTKIACKSESDIGKSEPYLWTVFFKIDGDMIKDGFLKGNATIYTTPGSHGNLNNKSVKSGDTINIPEKIGKWETRLAPIPLPALYQPKMGEDTPGFIGVVCILMEEDNVSDDGAEEGHKEMNKCIKNTLNSIIDSFDIFNDDLTDINISKFKDDIESAIKKAILSQQNIFENIWSAVNPDDTLGNHVFLFSLDDLSEDNNKTISKKWKKNDGKDEWIIYGEIKSTKVPNVVY